MSDIDYAKLFENGQLVHAVPEHLEVLHRMWQSYKGYPEESIFHHKYTEYLTLFHPEALAPVVTAAMPEPALPADPVDVPVESEVPLPPPVEVPLPEVAPEVPAEEVKDEAVKTEEDPVESKPKRGRGRAASSPK